jgi:hypothetical protein
MDLPIDNVDLRTIVAALEKSGDNDLAQKLMLVSRLIEEGGPYKKILREEYGMVA